MASVLKSQRKRRNAYRGGFSTAKKFKSKTISTLSVGMQGILITTNGKESQCVKEALRLLNEYADKLYKPQISEDASLEEDIGKELIAEVKSIKHDHEERFEVVCSGAKNVVFIKCHSTVDPCYLVHYLLCDIRDKKLNKTRYCIRIIPVTAICYTSLSEIKKCAKSVLQKHFHNADQAPVQFAINYKCRNNNDIKRDSVIDLLASVVTNNGSYDHIVNLKQPAVVVCTEIVKANCCLSVLYDFTTLKQYNIRSIMEESTPSTEAKDSSQQLSATDPVTVSTTT